MLKSCKYCGRIHDSKFDCGRKPAKQYRRTQEEAGRYTRAWVIKSDDIKSRSHYLCTYCLSNGAFTYDGLETHHIIPLRDRPDLLLEDSNLVCLCGKHHEMAERGEICADKLMEIARKMNERPPALAKLII